MTVAVILATGRAEGPSGAPGGAARLRAGLATVNVPDVIVIGRPGAGTAPGSPAIRVQPGSGTHPAASAVSAAPARKDGPRAARLARRLNGRRGLYWFKKILALPIGERFALIALTAALFDPRVTFLALLVWGSIAAAYTLTGRLVRTKTA